MKILNKLTIKYLLMNKKRTIVTIIGVILSTSLMVGIGLIVSSFRDSLIKDTKSFNGEQHLIINNIDNEKVKKLEEYNEIKEIKKTYYIDEYNKDEKYYSLYSIDKNILDKIKLTGNIPTNDKEVIIPKYLYLKLNDDIEINNKNYKIVGIYDDISYLNLPYEYTSYIYTTGLESENNTLLITFKDVKKAHTYIEKITKDLNLISDNYIVNTELLALEGSIKYKNIMDTIIKIVIIVFHQLEQQNYN